MFENAVELLKHLHDMLHAQGQVLHAQGKVLAKIATKVDALMPGGGIDPELAAALVEHQKHVDALKAALDVQPK